jgi:diguanylate cyclase (GGDEF)-like protein
LPETEVPQAAVLAERARRALEELALSFHGRPLSPITASFGVASFPLHGDDAAELVRAADAALYGAKAHGRNRVAVASAADPTLG